MYKFFGVSLIAVILFYGLIALGNLYQMLMFENKNSSLSSFLNFDIKNAIITMFISTVISFLFCVIFGGIFTSIFIEESRRETFINKFYIYVLLLNLLISSLAIFNTDQFSVLVGAISLAALVWPRIKS